MEIGYYKTKVLISVGRKWKKVEKSLYEFRIKFIRKVKLNYITSKDRIWIAFISGSKS